MGVLCSLSVVVAIAVASQSLAHGTSHRGTKQEARTCVRFAISYAPRTVPAGSGIGLHTEVDNCSRRFEAIRVVVTASGPSAAVKAGIAGAQPHDAVYRLGPNEGVAADADCVAPSVPGRYSLLARVSVRGKLVEERSARFRVLAA
jgi:hypothetical protein